MDRLFEILDLFADEGRLRGPAFGNHKDLYSDIDAIKTGEVNWKSFKVKYSGPLPEDGEPPPWMLQEYEVWFRDVDEVLANQLKNPTFANEMDWSPKRVFRRRKRQYCNFMSGNWSWRQAVS